MVAEAIAAQWLLDQGWTVLHHRWHCRWGEIDLIAQPTVAPQSAPVPRISTFNQMASHPMTSLVFIEVKARSRGNWDVNGLLSVTPAKQAKLWKAAELFLSEHPHLAECACRFDLILLRQRRSPLPNFHADQEPIQSPPSSSDCNQAAPKVWLPRPIQPGVWITVGQAQFCLDRHLHHAFE